MTFPGMENPPQGLVNVFGCLAILAVKMLLGPILNISNTVGEEVKGWPDCGLLNAYEGEEFDSGGVFSVAEKGVTESK